MKAYYNEIDPFAAQWLQKLIDQGHIADGVVDTRSISEVEPGDLKEFTQCHFFAGIGVWSHALRSAGWADSREVWTGSCPCQPFSTAGKGKGTEDERHLWPELMRLIGECRPPTIFGEQVAGKAGLNWLDLVSTDLEAQDYAFGAADLGACSVGAPHKRSRLYFVADTDGGKRHRRASISTRNNRVRPNAGRSEGNSCTALPNLPGSLADTGSTGLEGRKVLRERGDQLLAGQGSMVNGFWGDADWVLCNDPGGPRWRAAEPGTFPLADGAAHRVGRLRGYGNAIVAPLATEFIGAYMDIQS